jgi:thioredoxin-like negative regulator of GroEL
VIFEQGIGKGNKMSEKVTTVTDSSFENDVLQSSKLMLVDFGLSGVRHAAC